MKRKINLPRTFILLRELPPEVPFIKVEAWVKNHSIKKIQSNHWLTKWLARFP